MHPMAMCTTITVPITLSSVSSLPTPYLALLADTAEGKRKGREMTSRHIFFSLLALLLTVFFFFFTGSAISGDSDECVYTLYIQTGTIIKAGTDSTISAKLSDSKGKSVIIPDLGKWGLMGPAHDYYERGNLDIFTGLGPCIGSPICRLNLTSDGSGPHHGWFCEYVEVTSTGPHKGCGKSIFYVDQWLAEDAPPYQLTALLDGCKKENGPGPFVVGEPIRSASE